MSGFVAIINTNSVPVDNALLEQLTDSLRCKGTDRRKVWLDGPVGFGHTLFATTDEAQYEHQPSSLDGNIWITGSARIDARSDLVNMLGLQSEIQLDQTPDTDLILYAYRKWGEECVDHFRGDFAFVIWDKQHKRLFCVRDHFGMRQLYYARTRDCLVISNSLYCMSQHPAISRQLDDLAMGGFLLFGDHCWLDKELTIYADIKSLLPAHFLTFDDAREMVITEYWDIPANIELLRYRKESDYLDHFHELFQKAISDRLRTERVVLTMSGGMDSSSIAAILCEMQDAGNLKLDLNIITVVYNKLHPCREHYFADLIARKLGLSIQYVDGDQYPFISLADDTTRPVEIVQSSLWNDTMRKTSLFGRVALNGAAADNLLCYPAGLSALKEQNPWKTLVNILQLRKRYGKFPGLGTGLLNMLQGGWKLHGRKFSEPFPAWINNEFVERMYLKEHWGKRYAPPGKQSALRSRQSMLRDSLVVPDWCGDDIIMNNDFVLPEQRDPYLDVRMVEFVLSLPAIPWLFQKNILRRAMEKKLPREVVERPKTPLGLIDHSLLKLPDTEWIDEWQVLPELKEYVDRSLVPMLAGTSHTSVSSSYNLRPLMLNSWLKSHIE